MLTWLKRQFIPCACNNARPRFFCTKNARLMVIAILLLEVGLFVIPTLTYVYNQNLAQVLPGVLAALTNEERAAQQLPELAVNPLLSQAAELKARDMAEKGYFAHVSPDGTQPWQWLDAVGYQYDYAGENLAMNFTDSRDVTAAWMRSPTHRANIVKDTYTEVGTGVAQGTYQGKETIFVAQVYANPKSAARAPMREEAPPQAEAAASEPAAEVPPEEDREAASQTEETDLRGVLGAETAAPPAGELAVARDATLLERMFSSPRSVAQAVFFGLLIICSLALVVTIAVRIDVQHPDLITNALCVIALVLGILFVNEIYGRSAAVVSTSTDYSYTEAAPVL